MILEKMRSRFGSMGEGLLREVLSIFYMMTSILGGIMGRSF